MKRKKDVSYAVVERQGEKPYMWNRKELKAKGKEAFYANRATCIIAAIMLAVAGGFGGFITPTTLGTTNNNSNLSYEIEDNTTSDFEDSISADDGNAYESEDAFTEDSTLPLLNMLRTVVLVLAILTVLIIVLSIVVFNPLNVAMRKFFIDNATDPEAGINKSNIGMGFGSNWKNIIGAMITTDILIFLWSLLLVIPGIYKTYCWKMVPFIISENPAVSGKEARDKSTEMMRGNKWASFVLDLSFLGWRILAVFTLGILNMLFTNPYQACTDTELYLVLKKTLSSQNHVSSVEVVQ